MMIKSTALTPNVKTAVLRVAQLILDTSAPMALIIILMVSSTVLIQIAHQPLSVLREMTPVNALIISIIIAMA